MKLVIMVTVLVFLVSNAFGNVTKESVGSYLEDVVGKLKNGLQQLDQLIKEDASCKKKVTAYTELKKHVQKLIANKEKLQKRLNSGEDPNKINTEAQNLLQGLMKDAEKYGNIHNESC